MSSSNYSLSFSLLLTLKTCIFIRWIVYHKSLRFCSFFFILLTFCSSDKIIQVYYFNLTDFFFSVQICFWTLLGNFQFNYCIFLSPEFLFNFYNYCLLFLIFPFYLHIIFLIFFYSVLMFSFNYSNVFKMLILGLCLMIFMSVFLHE